MNRCKQNTSKSEVDEVLCESAASESSESESFMVIYGLAAGSAISIYEDDVIMSLTGCYAVLKYLVFLLNLVFWVSGLVIVVLSVWMLIDPTFYVSMAQHETDYYSGVCILFLGGALLFVVGFLGCFGAFKESQRLLVLYFCGLLIVLVAQVSAGIWAISNKDSLETLLRVTVRNTVQYEYGKLNSQRTDSFDAIQRELECCGADGPDDWSSSSWKGDEIVLNLSTNAHLKRYEIPKSCCNPKYPLEKCEQAIHNLQTEDVQRDVIFSEGCSNKLKDKLREYMTTVIVLFICIGIVEFMGLIVSLILCCAIRAVTKYK